MKRRYKPNVFRDIYEQPYSDLGITRLKLYKSSKNSLGMVQRLDLVKRLPVHNGCVNSISWNETGDYILSGSDDQHIVISHGFTHKVMTDFKTSHRANIFSAKFLPGQGDRHIVSCSGDGIILFTDLNRPQCTSMNQFSCHSGTTYDVITVSSDPYSFLSCGEDGTVRWFDLRVKDKCRKSQCKDDILIMCERAVTSLSVNPTAPYQLAVGCSDSRVRLFDRRMLGTVASGYSESTRARRPLSTFTVPSLKERSCRITSLNYSPDGEEILVSFSSDLLYLFSIKDRGSCENGSAEECDVDGPSTERSPAPVRRLRLRGDWSDTGPNARPERDAGMRGPGEFVQTRRTLHSSLMQRMTDVLSRMLNDPATRANLNGGRQSSRPPDGPPDAPTSIAVSSSANVSQDSPMSPDASPLHPSNAPNPDIEAPRSPVFPFEHPLNESFSVNPFLPLDSPLSPDPSPDDPADSAPNDLALPAGVVLDSPMSPDPSPVRIAGDHPSEPSSSGFVDLSIITRTHETPASSLMPCSSHPLPNAVVTTTSSEIFIVFSPPDMQRSNTVSNIPDSPMSPCPSLSPNSSDMPPDSVMPPYVDCRSDDPSIPDSPLSPDSSIDLNENPQNVALDSCLNSVMPPHVDCRSDDPSIPDSPLSPDPSPELNVNPQYVAFDSCRNVACDSSMSREFSPERSSDSSSIIMATTGNIAIELVMSPESSPSSLAGPSITPSPVPETLTQSSPEDATATLPENMATESKYVQLIFATTNDSGDLSYSSQSPTPGNSQSETSIDSGVQPADQNLQDGPIGESKPEETSMFTFSDAQAKMELINPLLDDNFHRDSPLSPPMVLTENVAIQVTERAEAMSEDEVDGAASSEFSGQDMELDSESSVDADTQQFPRVMYPRPRQVMIPPGDVTQLRNNEDLIDTLHSMRHRHATEPAVLLSVSGVTETGAAFAVRLATETNRGPPDIPFLPQNQRSQEVLRPPVPQPPPEDEGNDAEEPTDGDDDMNEEEIDDMTPNFRLVHPIERDMDCAIAEARSSGVLSEDQCSFQPSVKQVFSGHRNARTMIKEACFWGTDYIMSGSDCGHVFVWERCSGQLVQLFEGDDHVVNCLQPHPTLPVLATSGIDYDVKLWAPLAADSTFDTALADMLKKRNEIMLEETKDTITVPATFMIRMLACLNQIRRGGRRTRRTDDESTE